MPNRHLSTGPDAVSPKAPTSHLSRGESKVYDDDVIYDYGERAVAAAIARALAEARRQHGGTPFIVTEVLVDLDPEFEHDFGKGQYTAQMTTTTRSARP